jgi:putative glutamine amidotransferase
MPRVALQFGTYTPEEKRIPYRSAMRAAGIEQAENVTSVNGLSGLVLTGGSDVDPAIYGKPRHPKTLPPDLDRDRLEIDLLHEALRLRLPVLAICRGLQLVNVALGGTLNQHIEGHRLPGIPEVHPVIVAPASRLAAIFGEAECVVNSRHHQSVDRVADGLMVSARAPDGIVEALELPGTRFLLAVQWHPEDRIDGPDGKLFKAFREALGEG